MGVADVLLQHGCCGSLWAGAGVCTCGTAIYSNSGARIGEIEDFVMAKVGTAYAVIATSKDPIADLRDLNKDEMVIVALRELRRASMPKAKSTSRTTLISGNLSGVGLIPAEHDGA